jgi:hypothetical protein
MSNVAQKNAPLLNAIGLKKYYPVKKGMFEKTQQVKALDGVSFSLERGKTLAVVGESGCGKSTLGRLLTMIEEPTEGELYYNGQNFLENDHETKALRRQKIQIVFQNPYASLNPRKKIGTILEEPLVINTNLSAKRPLLIGLYATTVIIVSAHFTAYTYIEPFMVQIGELDPNLATIILLVFGVSGITASVIFNRLYRFGPTQFISTAMILLAVSLAFMLVSASYTATMFTLAFIWGIGISCIGLALQMRVLQLAPDATDVASAIYSGIFNAGIGAGALFGNQIARHIGLEYIGFMGAALAMIALGIFVFFNFRYRTQNV